MDVRQLSALVAVAEHGSFSAAADALHTVQSNVSAHVARLERELGATLVQRPGCALTPEGEVVVNRARRVAAELDAIAADVAALRQEVSGSVRLGLIGTTGRWLAPHLLAAVAAQHPGVKLRLFEGTSASLQPQLGAGRLDAAVVNLPLPAGEFFTQPLFDEDVVLVVHRSDARAKRKVVDVADLEGLPLLLPLAGTAFRSELDAAAKAAGVKLVTAAELDGIRLIASLTFDGHGPSVLPATAVPRYLRDEWCPVAVRGLPPRRIGVAQLRRGLPSAPARAVLAVLRQVVADNASEQSGVHLVR